MFYIYSCLQCSAGFYSRFFVIKLFILYVFDDLEFKIKIENILVEKKNSFRTFASNLHNMNDLK